MRLKAIHIWFRLLLLITLFSFTDVLCGQDTREISNYRTRFQKNLEELSDLYCWADSGFYFGKIEMLPVSNFSEEFKKLDLHLFASPVEQAEDFFSFLNNLPVKQKEQLIRYFYSDDNYFSKTIQSAGLPEELKYMAPALSAMNDFAAGEDNCAGIWQLTHFQGILNGLTINRFVDERFNEQRAVQGYVKEIKQNQELFGSVELAVIAQWFGRTKMQNALYFTERDKSLNKILEYFPETVTEKIAAFQAAAVFLNVNRMIEKPGASVRKVIPDTVNVTHQLHFKQVSEVLNIPEKQLAFLNPQYRFEIVPAGTEHYKLLLPKGFRNDFMIWQDSIYNALDSSIFEITAQKIEYPPAPGRQYLGEPVKDLEIEGKTKIQYRLKTGDVLGIIAEKYDVRVEDLKYWNNIANERRIQAGRNLDIFVDNDQLEYYRNIDKNEQEERSPTNNVVNQLQQVSALKVLEDLKQTPKVDYVVKSGESPYTIAKKFRGVTTEDILLWNNIDDARKIQVGQKLIIYLKE